ncbi:MAG: hypothetical protein Q4A16_06810 [Lautropia sp.]|nr:hypothetical protein [Lautropia sp.]
MVQPWPRLTEEAAYVMEKMSHGLQRLGRADGGGFYDYDDWDEAGGDDEDGRELWDGLKAFIRRGTEIPDADLQDRLRFAPVVELLHALAAGVVLDIDATYAHATGEANPGDNADSTIGSPPETARRAALNLTARCGLWPTGRSPLAPIEALGEEGFERRAAELASHFGERFELPDDWRRALSKP